MTLETTEPTPAPEAAPKTYGGDYEGIKDAAEELSEAREAGTVPQQSEPEEPVEAPIDRRWETPAEPDGREKPVLEMGADKGVSPEDAARALSAVRQMERSEGEPNFAAHSKRPVNYRSPRAPVQTTLTRSGAKTKSCNAGRSKHRSVRPN